MSKLEINMQDLGVKGQLKDLKPKDLFQFDYAIHQDMDKSDIFMVVYASAAYVGIEERDKVPCVNLTRGKISVVDGEKKIRPVKGCLHASKI